MFKTSYRRARRRRPCSRRCPTRTDSGSCASCIRASGPVGALEAAVGLSQSALSQHLARLRRAGLVTTRRKAQTIGYSIADRRLDRIMSVLHELFCEAGPPPRKRA